jgi:hypothetical protein
MAEQKRDGLQALSLESSYVSSGYLSLQVPTVPAREELSQRRSSGCTVCC